MPFEYHERTKHRLSKYAAGPETLDWSAQPNPFREFEGCARVELPLNSSLGELAIAALSIKSIGALLQLSMGLSAWKEYGPDRWALRVNPSSGNLHPSEAYVLCCGVSGIGDGLYHYVSRDHALELRCAGKFGDGTKSQVWIGVSSIHWREAWKYGERAFRYCQLDVGHAIGALRYAAAALGWGLRLVHPLGHSDLSRLLGLDREADFGRAEREDAEVLLEIVPGPAPSHGGEGTWAGKANVLDPHPMYRWPAIDCVAFATRQRSGACSDAAAEPQTAPSQWNGSPMHAVDVILKRRSAQRFDPGYTMSAAVFQRLTDSLAVSPAVPWDVWNFAPRTHPLLFVHRVEGLAPGLYVFPRRAGAESELRATLKPGFLWEQKGRLFLLEPGYCERVAVTVSCHQAIARDCCFSLGMLSEFEGIVKADPWRYRQLHWEAGLVGHVLYLEAEAAGLRGTGVGCYFDDVVHELAGLRGLSFASLYHFCVGRPLMDERIMTLPPYPERNL
jgi:SagB-type dehydrogenase family enzyme